MLCADCAASTSPVVNRGRSRNTAQCGGNLLAPRCGTAPPLTTTPTNNKRSGQRGVVTAVLLVQPVNVTVLPPMPRVNRIPVMVPVVSIRKHSEVDRFGDRLVNRVTTFSQK